jgi:adenylylsulfate kinase
MTGISAPYEAPLNPGLEVVTDGQPIEESVKTILEFINKKLKPST